MAKWCKSSSEYELGRGASIIEYNSIIKSSEDEINYVIVAYNTILDTVTKDYEIVSGNELSMNKIYDYFYKENDNYAIRLF